MRSHSVKTIKIIPICMCFLAIITQQFRDGTRRISSAIKRESPARGRRVGSTDGTVVVTTEMKRWVLGRVCPVFPVLKPLTTEQVTGKLVGLSLSRGKRVLHLTGQLNRLAAANGNPYTGTPELPPGVLPNVI
jgi:hypothetical protein